MEQLSSSVVSIQYFEEENLGSNPYKIWRFCSFGEVGDEVHFIMRCQTFNTNRACFMGKLGSLNQSFSSLLSDQQLNTILCPKSTSEAKIVYPYYVLSNSQSVRRS